MEVSEFKERLEKFNETIGENIDFNRRFRNGEIIYLNEVLKPFCETFNIPWTIEDEEKGRLFGWVNNQ